MFQQIYNFVQVVVCSWMSLESLRVAYMNGYFLTDNKFDPKKTDVAWIFWAFYVSKVLDFLDTVFIIFAQKWRQLTFLHLYHHTSIVYITWIGMNIGKPPKPTFCIFKIFLIFIIFFILFFVPRLRWRLLCYRIHERIGSRCYVSVLSTYVGWGLRLVEEITNGHSNYTICIDDLRGGVDVEQPQSNHSERSRDRVHVVHFLNVDLIFPFCTPHLCLERRNVGRTNSCRKNKFTRKEEAVKSN